MPLLIALLLALAGASAAQAEVVWLCKPGMSDDPCEIPLDTTVRAPDGSERVHTPRRLPQSERRVDCFYVYPTVSNQPTANSDQSRDPELESIARYQAARFSTRCRIYAPIYRQRTLAALVGSSAGATSDEEAHEIAYTDVAEAWNAYLEHDNRGRGVVLLGHSQGTRMLRMLIEREIEPRAKVRRRIVGGLLLGGNVITGEFPKLPACTRRGEAGCLVAYSTYATDPPEDSRFGIAPEPGGQVACTDPATLSGNDEPFGVTVPTEPFAPGIIHFGILATSGGRQPTAPTTWVTERDRFQGGCRTIGAAHVLRYDPLEGSRRPGNFPDDTWGTHLIDMNLALGRLVTIVRKQVRHWTRPRIRVVCRGAKVRVRGADAHTVRRVERRGGGRVRLRLSRGRPGPLDRRC